MRALFYIYTIIDFLIFFVLSCSVASGNTTYSNIFGEYISVNYYDGKLEDKLLEYTLVPILTEFVSFVLLAIIGVPVFDLFKIFFISLKVAYVVYIIYFFRYLIRYLDDKKSGHIDLDDDIEDELEDIRSEIQEIQENMAYINRIYEYYRYYMRENR